MKTGPYLLINLLLVAGGIFVYHSLVAEDTRRGSDTSAYDTYDTSTPASPSSDAGGLDGGGVKTLAFTNAKRLDRIEALLTALQERGTGRPTPVDEGETSEGRALGDHPPALPALDPDEVLRSEDPLFREDTIKALEAYMDEINRRKAEQRQRDRIAAELARLQLELSASEREAVVNETLKFQARSRKLMRQNYPRDESGLLKRNEDRKALKDEWATVINRLVPSSHADKILNSRIARGMGFYSGPNFPMRGGGRRGR